MRIIQTVNDTIRLLFNPKTEVFRLSDFLLVRDYEESFLAQVIEVYDDKFDQESNVAKIKLIFKIVNGNEIAPYDNYTPSRECEVAKIKQSDIEKCINLNKKTINIGKNALSKEEMFLNTNFFDNNCAIFADRFEQTNQIFENLAPRLANYKNVLILDCSGTCNIEGAGAYIAGESFKMPLSSKTIDYIQQKTLFRAKLETQVVLGEVFEEVKNFLKTSEEDYIPYARFVKVIQNQCRQTPSVELLVLISWLKKYARSGIFARNKREFEAFFKSVEKNKITILDMSNIKTEWQKEIVDYITDTIKKDTFVLIRLNDNNINNDILNAIYLKRKNITLVPGFAYGYKKMGHIMEFVQNCILMPTNNPRRDFGHANFQIECLNKDSFMLFGEDTKDFIFILENEIPARRVIKKSNDDTKDKMFISLNLQLEDMTPLELMPDNFEVRAKRRPQEEINLSDVLKEQPEEQKIEPVNIQEEEPVIEEDNTEEVLEEEILEEEALEETSFENEDLDYFEQLQEAEKKITEDDSSDEIIEIQEDIEEQEQEENVTEEDEKAASIAIEKALENTEDFEEEIPIDEDILDAIDEENKIAQQGAIEEQAQATVIDEVIQEKIETEEQTSSDEDNSKEDDEIDKKFDEILNETEESIKEESAPIVSETPVKTEEKKLPVFDEDENMENSETSVTGFKEGDTITHETYGEGSILKVIKYGSRCLLQIEFPKVGKRLLDPKIAKLK